MANKVYPPGAGDVELVLGNETLILKPTLQAGLTISRMSGGIRSAIDKVMALDLDTIVAIIRAGIGPKEAKRLTHLDELVYENGLMDSQGRLLGKLVDFLSNVARGGRPDDDDNKGDGEGANPPSPLTH